MSHRINLTSKFYQTLCDNIIQRNIITQPSFLLQNLQKNLCEERFYWNRKIVHIQAIFGFFEQYFESVNSAGDAIE